jgi:hypothetical protein
VWEGELEDYDGREITHDEYFSRCCFDVSLCYLIATPNLWARDTTREVCQNW